MDRVTINFYPDVYTKLMQRAKEKRKSFSEYVRNLVELGLRIEEMSEKKAEEAPPADPALEALAYLQKLMERTFVNGQESAYYARYLVNSNPAKDSRDNEQYIADSKLRAKTVMDVLKEEYQRGKSIAGNDAKAP